MLFRFEEVLWERIRRDCCVALVGSEAGQIGETKLKLYVPRSPWSCYFIISLRLLDPSLTWTGRDVSRA